MSRLFLFDVDSTLINEEVIDLIAEYAGVAYQVSAITERAMSGQLDFDAALTERVALLADLPISILDSVKSKITLTEGASEVIAQLQADGDHIAVVSGGFLEVITPLMHSLAISYFIAYSLVVVAGKLSGRVLGAIVNSSGIASYLMQLQSLLNPTQTIAIGDGANDIEMIKAADIGIAFCAKSSLREAADIVIEQRDLREILKFL
ncbi:MAG: phosphoserine phosphatase SerB [Candidatus Nanopelagicaceae bacterium]